MKAGVDRLFMFVFRAAISKAHTSIFSSPSAVREEIRVLRAAADRPRNSAAAKAGAGGTPKRGTNPRTGKLINLALVACGMTSGQIAFVCVFFISCLHRAKEPLSSTT